MFFIYVSIFQMFEPWPILALKIFNKICHLDLMESYLKKNLGVIYYKDIFKFYSLKS